MKSAFNHRNLRFTGMLAFLLAGFIFFAPGVQAAESKDGKSVKMEQQQAKVNINRASAKELESLSGIGQKKAMAIVNHRKSHGKFKTIESLAQVKGIGNDIVEKNRQDIVLK